MRAASRFAVAVHVLALLSSDDACKDGSERLAESIGVNPVVVRNMLGMLRRAGIVSTHRGVRGCAPTRPLDAITLYDVYRAVEPHAELFTLHRNPSPDCPIGANIQASLEVVLDSTKHAIESELAAVTVAAVVDDIRERSSGKAPSNRRPRAKV